MDKGGTAPRARSRQRRGTGRSLGPLRRLATGLMRDSTKIRRRRFTSRGIHVHLSVFGAVADNTRGGTMKTFGAKPSRFIGDAASLGKSSLALLVVGAAFLSGMGQAVAAYVQTNLVSNIPGLATITEPLLVNPWGTSRSATSPFWTSNQGTNTSTLFGVLGSTNVSEVTGVNAQGFVSIPTTASGPQGPTGQVNNTNTASFQLTPGVVATSSRFIFADLNGTISGWAGGLTSTIKVSTPGAVYTGLAIDTAGTRLYAANGAGATINVFDSAFAPTTVAGGFTDPTLPAGLVPFNVQNIGGNIYVTYAPAGLAAQRAATAGMGRVDVFDENGFLLQTLISDSELAAPWGVAVAPA